MSQVTDDSNIIALPLGDARAALGDEEVLAWLRDRRPVQMTVTELAKLWGWERTRASKRLKAWAETGLIDRSTLPGGKSLIKVCGDRPSGHVPVAEGAVHRVHDLHTPEHGLAHHADHPVQAAILDELASPVVPRSVQVVASVRTPCTVCIDEPVHAVPAGVQTHGVPAGVQTHGRTLSRTLGAIVLGVVACGLAGCGILINADYGASLGKTERAADLFAALSVGADALALILPATPACCCATAGTGPRWLPGPCGRWSSWSPSLRRSVSLA